MSLHIFMAGDCWISSLQGSPGGRAGDVSGVEWSGQGAGGREGRKKPGWSDECQSGEMARWDGGEVGGGWMRGWVEGWQETKRTQGGGYAALSGGEAQRMEKVSSGGITNRQDRCNGWRLIAAEMESTLQVLNECSTSGARPWKEQIIVLAWSGASVSLQKTREMCRGGNEIEGEWENFRETLAFLVFSGLLEMSQKVTVCLATHLFAQCLFQNTRKPKLPSFNYPSCISKLRWLLWH